MLWEVLYIKKRYCSILYANAVFLCKPQSQGLKNLKLNRVPVAETEHKMAKEGWPVLNGHGLLFGNARGGKI